MTALLSHVTVYVTVYFIVYDITFRGGLSAPAFIHGTMVPEELRGSEYNGELHVTGTEWGAF